MSFDPKSLRIVDGWLCVYHPCTCGVPGYGGEECGMEQLIELSEIFRVSPAERCPVMNEYTGERCGLDWGHAGCDGFGG